ncbi:MAG: AMP-dependent synthetase [Flavobacteriales bacterium]|nr:AMP-dependent synthetase [Flavobacteriales bacterium]|tara:strand:- start:13819 stop:15336 length:1518 start_codon:yes stop_codon:yes gene_type:complete
MNNIIDLFINASQSYPSNVAIIEKEHKIDYQTLEKQVRQTAMMLKEKGVNKGDRVLIFIPMSIHLYRIVLAVFYVGAIAVFLDEWVSKSRMEICCKIAKCKAFVSDRKIRVLSFFSKELRKIPVKIGTHLMTEQDVLKSPEHMNLKNDTALITFTTGSTGIPKAANRTHGFLREQFKALSKEIDPKSSDIDMPLLPIVLLCNLAVGATSLIVSFNSRKLTEMKSKRIVKQIFENKVNRITASPFFFDHISRYLISTKITLPRIEKIFTGGAPVFPNQVKRYKNAFLNSSINIAYGSTEAEPISLINGTELVSCEEEILKKGLCVGNLYSEIELKIIRIVDDIIETKDDNLTEIELEKGDVGEIVVAGNHVLKSYINNDKAFRRNKILTENKVWHRTGDSGRMEGQKLYLFGRCSQLIKDHNSYLSPFVYEYMIRTYLGFSCGTLLEIDGQIILVIEGDAHSKKEIPNELIKHDSVIYVRNIPRDPRHYSKIDYPKLILNLKKNRW